MLTLVTGATGLIGNNVVRLLLDRGHAVRVLLRESSDARPLSGLDVEIVRGDVCHTAAVRRACEGVQCVIHAAGYVHIGWSGSKTHHAVNVLGTANVAGAALAAEARMVHVSSVDALGIRTREEPADEETPREGHVLCPYVLTKRAAEDEILKRVAHGLDAVIVNPNYVIGPWDWKPSSGRMILQVARGRGLLAPPGGNDFCDVRDVSAGILAAAQRGHTGRRYILSGESLSYLEAWRLFAKVSGARAPLGVATARMVGIAGKLGDAWGRVTRKEPAVNSAATALSILPHHFSNARAAAELEYQPRPVRGAVEAAWRWFVETGYV